MLDYDTMEWTNNLKRMVAEVLNWAMINSHPNICKLYEVYEANNHSNVYLRTELGELGCLAEFDTKSRIFVPNPMIA